MSKKILLVTLLIVSIGLNLVFAGIVVGRYLYGTPPGRDHFEWMTQEVSEATRSKLRSSMRQHMQETRPVRRELREAQDQLRAAIVSDEYVEADVTARLSDLRRVSAELQESMHEQMVENLRHLAPEERVQVLGMMMLKDRGRRGPPSQHSGRLGGPPQD